MPGWRTIAFIIVALAAGGSMAADGQRGQQLYENHCTACHDSVAHERPTRKADSPAALRRWVDRWRRHLELDWTEDEIADVTAYLARDFYRFDAGASK